MLRSPGGLSLAVGDDDAVVIADHDHCRHYDAFADQKESMLITGH